jgi:hypothetical protein
VLFPLLGTVNSVAVNMYLFECLFPIPLSIHLDTGIVGSYGVSMFSFLEQHQLFSTSSVSFYISISDTGRYWFPTSWTLVNFSLFFIIAFHYIYCSGWEVVPHCDKTMIFKMVMHVIYLTLLQCINQSLLYHPHFGCFEVAPIVNNHVVKYFYTI